MSDHDHSHSSHSDHSSCDQSHDHSHLHNTSQAALVHGHSHEHMDSPGQYISRPSMKKRKYSDRAFCVGIGGPVGSGKVLSLS
jgi:urease accessory protein